MIIFKIIYKNIIGTLKALKENSATKNSIDSVFINNIKSKMVQYQNVPTLEQTRSDLKATLNERSRK